MTDTQRTEHLFPLSIIHDSIRWGSADAACLLCIIRTLLAQSKCADNIETHGRLWTISTFEYLADQLPWLMVDEVQKIVLRLQKARYLLSEPFQTKSDKYSNLYKFSLNEPAYQFEPRKLEEKENPLNK